MPEDTVAVNPDDYRELVLRLIVISYEYSGINSRGAAMGTIVSCRRVTNYCCIFLYIFKFDAGCLIVPVVINAVNRDPRHSGIRKLAGF